MSTRAEGNESRREELRKKLIRNWREATLTTETRAPLYDGGMSGGVVGIDLEGMVCKKLGAGVDILPPGKRAVPYHFHYAQEEMFVILEGEGTLRVADELLPIHAGDVICIPAGPEYPHQLINTSRARLVYLSISTQEYPEIAEYPDSQKYMAYTKQEGPILRRRKMQRAGTALDYWDGEK